jgi:hypothetical protein
MPFGVADAFSLLQDFSPAEQFAFGLASAIVKILANHSNHRPSYGFLCVNWWDYISHSTRLKKLSLKEWWEQ